MEYKGKYEIFDAGRISTYPVSGRKNKVMLSDLLEPAAVVESGYEVSGGTEELIEKVSRAIVDSRRGGRPVILFTGAHLIKNGLGKLVIDLVDRGMVTLVAGNGATAIHGFELALIG